MAGSPLWEGVPTTGDQCFVCGSIIKVRRDLSRAGRAHGGAVAFSDDVERLIPPRKQGVAFSLGAMGSRQHNFYNAAYRRAGYEDVAIDVQNLWLDGRREEAAARVPDELVLRTNFLGTDDMVKERIRAYRDAGVTTLRVNPAGESVSERLETLGRFADLVAAVGAE